MAKSDDIIRFAWDIHYKCNYRCPYCWFYKEWAHLNSRNIYISPEEWMKHWKRIYDIYGEVKIEIVGGEPFIYPNFIDLVKRVSSLHLIKVTTNLSGDIKRFVEEIDPKRVELDLNFHILFMDLETAIKRAMIFKKAGFKAGICYLAYPPQMYAIRSLSERFKKEGINFALAAFWGEYNGKKYPSAYTEEEKEMIRPFLGDIDRIAYHLNARMPKGRMCNAGYRYASIKADGKVVRCGPLGEKSIGNITDENFRLLEMPLPCEAEACPCDEYINMVDDVRFPRTAPPYRVHWNWELGYSCNYQCSYCHLWPKGKFEKYLNIDIRKWKDIWDRMFEKYGCSHVRFSGGEPTIYPDFFDIVSMLLERHTVDITTNLSFDIKSFTEKVKAGGISISASFHPEFDKMEAFLEKVIFLHNSGYPSTIAYVAFPPHLKDMPLAKTLVEKDKIMFKIIPYQGEFQGKKYPDSYTREERLLIEGISADSENGHLKALNYRWYDWNVKRNKENKTKKGSLCRMGQMYAKIYPDGEIARCCAMGHNGERLGVLGRITDLDFRLLDSPMPCEAESCPCFKGMLVGFEEEKWLPLWEAPEHPIHKTEDIKRLAHEEQTRITVSDIVANPEENKVEAKKIERQIINPFRIFFTWDIHYSCNYRCEYCFFSGKWEEWAKENREPGLDAWKEIWDKIYKKYGSAHIHISGGEPFTYPSFMELVRHLTQHYTVEFDTNLSFDVDEFISSVRPGRTKFAAAFHPAFIELEPYLAKALKLKQAGYDIGINYVAYPPQLDRMKEYKTAFEKNSISFTTMPFRGDFEGRAYPQGYTEEQKELIRQCGTNLTISSKMIEWYGKDRLSRKGVMCRMGQMYTKIHPNGDAFRCCYIKDEGRLGNIIDGTFSLWDEPKLCEYLECPCWTAMVIGQEEEWQSHWVIPK